MCFCARSYEYNSRHRWVSVASHIRLDKLDWIYKYIRMWLCVRVIFVFFFLFYRYILDSLSVCAHRCRLSLYRGLHRRIQYICLVHTVRLYSSYGRALRVANSSSSLLSILFVLPAAKLTVWSSKSQWSVVCLCARIFGSFVFCFCKRVGYL